MQFFCCIGTTGSLCFWLKCPVLYIFVFKEFAMCYINKQRKIEYHCFAFVGLCDFFGEYLIISCTFSLLSSQYFSIEKGSLLYFFLVPSIVFCIRLFDILYMVDVIKDAQILTTASARLQKISRKRNQFGYLHATVIAKGIFL